MANETFNYEMGYRSSCKYHSKGTMNLILSAPHGGLLAPDDVPDRTNGLVFRSTANVDPSTPEEICRTNVISDTRTAEFAENVARALTDLCGLKPFIVIGKWHRKKVDFNRELREGTLHQPEAKLAYESYHRFLTDAVDQVNRHFGHGLLLDIHGHSKGNYTMLGYMLSSSQLNRDELSPTSIESLCRTNREESIRGQTSFGTILERQGLGIVYPSLEHPKPASAAFFSGGFITNNYSSKINTIQTELPYDIRTGPHRLDHAKQYAQAILEYMHLHHLIPSSITKS